MTLTASRIVPSPNAFAIDPTHTQGIVLRVLGGFMLGVYFVAVPDAQLALVDNATNYVECSAVGSLQSNTVGFTAGAVFLYRVVTGNGRITSIEDWRGSPRIPDEGLSGSGPIAVLSLAVTLTDAQIKALPATPLELIPAPGAGKIIVPLALNAIKSGAAYDDTGSADGNLWLVYTPTFSDGGAGGFAVKGGQWKPAATAPGEFFAIAVANPDASSATSDVDNQPVLLWHDAPAITGGGAGTTLQLIIVYTVVDVS